MTKERETAVSHSEEERTSLLTRFLKDHMREVAQVSALGGVLVLLGAGISALLLSGSPSYSEAGGFAKAVVWVVWLAVLGVTATYKWRVMFRSAEEKGYQLSELYSSIIRDYLPVGGSVALLALGMTVAVCRLDHAEYLLGLWLMAWGCAAVVMGILWTMRSILVFGVSVLALGFLQVLLWPTHVLLTVGMLGLLLLFMAAYFWYAS